ncbi:hypothetical protein [Streptomyces poriferorum]|uniref:Uncharacterized protein n=1 Tax=Streptomyces poriferorum TaxID=2798799 RepID=A0ABY9J755_9ACTN|nr:MULTISPECIES: hypothetical protein [unclassified Streptomyces]MDP5309432.1 hypothetical protein [Streptomyces sp. Alt4]WLQ61962.1 hypothetical protein P8A19_40805 [Streptomyces sp. Alt2]
MVSARGSDLASVGGPADGGTEHRPLAEATGKVHIGGETYRGNPGLPPEVKDTPEGLANGLPAVEDCTPWEDLRETHLARLVAKRPAVA